MEFICSEELLSYMKKKKRSTIVVEIAKSDSSDFEVVELHVHLTDEKQAALFVERQKFRRIETDFGAVLLPNYRLEYEPEIRFGLKKLGPIAWMTHEGIKL